MKEAKNTFKKKKFGSYKRFDFSQNVVVSNKHEKLTVVATPWQFVAKLLLWFHKSILNLCLNYPTNQLLLMLIIIITYSLQYIDLYNVPLP